MMEQRELTFSEIRTLAIQAGENEWCEFITNQQEILGTQCIGYGRAWMFFRHSDIEIPEHANMRKCAIVVSKYGEVRKTADFSPDYNECMMYLKTMSEHFEERNL